MAEYWDLYDENRNPTGEVHLRGGRHPDDRYHLSVHVWIRDDRDRFLISRRHPSKTLPLYWETVGGAVVAGEDSRAGAVRELSEELGISVKPEALTLLKTERREWARDFLDSWLVRWNGSAEELTLQPDEVIDARWMTYDELCALDAEGGKFADSLYYFRMLFGGDGLPVKIGLMRPEDYDDVYAFWSRTPGMGLNDRDDTREGVERFLRRNPTTCFVARSPKGIVGSILAGHDGRRGHLYHAAVDPELRGRRVGAGLVRAALDALKREGIAKASLLVFSDNFGGNRFWESMGFTGRDDVNYLNIQLLEMNKFDPK